MAETLELPLVDLSSPDRAYAAKSIRHACLNYGFFYLINHGVEDSIFQQLFRESKNFFSLPLHQKMNLKRNKDNRGYSPLYAETLDPSSKFKGDLKESFYIGPAEGNNSQSNPNQWPSKESLPFWRSTMESYHEKVLTVGKRLVSLIALALNLDDQYFEKIGALHPPLPVVRLLHYPAAIVEEEKLHPYSIVAGEVPSSDDGNYGASAHSDYGMVTLLATDGVPGLQICREKDRQPQFWEDVPPIDGAFIVNVGDMLERWTNCLFRSTLHRVLAVGRERYSVAFFLDPNPDCIVKCLENCCDEKSPPRFPPVRSGDYLQERFRVTKFD